MNLIIIMGNLTRDPEMKFSQSGMAITNFDVAVNRVYFKNEQKQQDVTYFPVTAFGKQAESCDTFLKKGKKVLVKGRLQISSYEDKEGIKRKGISVVADSVTFLSSKNESSDETPSNDGGYSSVFKPESNTDDDF